MRARTSLSAWIMSVLGGEVDRQLGGPPDRLRADAHHAEHDADDLLDRPGDGDLDILDGQAGRLGDDDDPREGHLGIDAAGHAEHRHDAEGGQQARGQHDQPEVRPGHGDEIDPAAGGPMVLGFRLQGQAHRSASAWRYGLGHGQLDRRALGQVVSALDDHRLALLQVGPRDGHPAAVRCPGLGVERDRLPLSDDVQDRPLAQVEDRGGRDLQDVLPFIHGDRHPQRLARA